MLWVLLLSFIAWASADLNWAIGILLVGSAIVLFKKRRQSDISKDLEDDSEETLKENSPTDERIQSITKRYMTDKLKLQMGREPNAVEIRRALNGEKIHEKYWVAMPTREQLEETEREYIKQEDWLIGANKGA